MPVFDQKQLFLGKNGRKTTKKSLFLLIFSQRLSRGFDFVYQLV